MQTVQSQLCVTAPSWQTARATHGQQLPHCVYAISAVSIKYSSVISVFSVFVFHHNSFITPPRYVYFGPPSTLVLQVGTLLQLIPRCPEQLLPQGFFLRGPHLWPLTPPPKAWRKLCLEIAAHVDTPGERERREKEIENPENIPSQEENPKFV